MHEDGFWRRPSEGFKELFGDQLEIKSLFVWVTRNTAEAFSKRFRITMLATGTYLCASPHGVPCRVSPFDLRCTRHLQSLLYFKDSERQSRLIARRCFSSLIASASVLPVRLTAERLSPFPSEEGQYSQVAIYNTPLLDPQTLERCIPWIGVEAGLKLREQLSGNGRDVPHTGHRKQDSLRARVKRGLK